MPYSGESKGESFFSKATDGGSGFAQNAGGIANFALQGYQQLSQEAESDKAADARTLNLALQGGQVGMSVGGPLGAAAGAVLGGVAGMLKKVPDRKKRVKKEYEEYKGKLFDEKNTRDALADDFDNQQQVENLMDLKKAQMGVINLNY